MANTPRVIARAEPDLIRDAAERAERDGQLAPGSSVSTVIRYALAVVAGRPDPHRVAVTRPGPKPKVGATA